MVLKLLSDWKMLHITAEIPGKNCHALEVAWFPGGGIELPCNYFFYADKIQGT